MLECPVALVDERFNTGRKKTSWVLGALIALFSIYIVFNFGGLFGFVAMVATQYLQPIAALLFCLFGGWVWSRASKIKELEQGCPDFQLGWFGKVWPWYVKFICPVLVVTVIWASFG
jgi:NSS family neurotransmitter:Na+ symporter